MRRVSAVLVHYPVLDRKGATVTSAITNIDLHDISRSALSYGLEAFYVVHPIAAQRELANRIRDHWTTGSGPKRMPDRQPAMERLAIKASLEDALADFEPNGSAELWTTSAAPRDGALTWPVARAQISTEGPPVMLCFGTGWGLSAEVYEQATVHIHPIHGAAVGGYNHLSVRAAAAILLARLLAC